MSPPRKVVVWGASGHARVVADILRAAGEYEVFGFLDDLHPERHGSPFCGATVLGGREQLPLLARSGVVDVLLGVGDCRARLALGDEVRSAGLALARAVHPAATVTGRVTIGEGTVVCAGAVVGTGARVGANVIVNTSASVDHDCVVEEGAHVCPGVRLAGGVCVGRAAWVGIGATVIQGVRVGAGSVIGAGAVVLYDIPDNAVAYGVPAKVIRTLFHDAQVDLNDLALFGGAPAFPQPLHVGRPNVGDRTRLMERLGAMLDRRWLTNDGPVVREFERRIADLVGVRHCIAMCNATVALEIAIRALELKGEVLVPSFTFIATAHALQWQEITPVFCDIDPRTHNIDPASLGRMVTPRTSGVIGVHVWGRPCEVDGLADLAAQYHLKLLFDAAHAFGCSSRGRKVGGFGEAEVFSFHATKFLNAFEGGAVVTNNDTLAEKMKLMRNFGFAGYDNVIYIGTNGKMSEASAAMGLTSLESMKEFIAVNRCNYELYRKHLAGIPGLALISYDTVDDPNYQYVVVEVERTASGLSRDLLVEILMAENVIARRYFYPGCHRMEPYRSCFPHSHFLLPATEEVAGRVLLLPTGTAVSATNIAAIADVLKFSVAHAGELLLRRQGAVT